MGCSYSIDVGTYHTEHTSAITTNPRQLTISVDGMPVPKDSKELDEQQSVKL
jgi:hypothetical protein